MTLGVALSLLELLLLLLLLLDDFVLDEDDDDDVVVVDTDDSLSWPLLELFVLLMLLMCLLVPALPPPPSLSLPPPSLKLFDDDDTDLLEPKPLELVDVIEVELRWLLVELLEEFCEPDTWLLLLADDEVRDVLLLDFFVFEFVSGLARLLSASFSGEDGASLECASWLMGL